MKQAQAKISKTALMVAALLLSSTSLWADSISNIASHDAWQVTLDMNANGFSGFKNSTAVADFKAGNDDYAAVLWAVLFGNWKVANADFQAAINDWNGAAITLGDSSLRGTTAVPEPGVWMLLGCAGLVLIGALRVKFSPAKASA